MFLRMIYDDALAQAAYLIGCQRSGEAVIIDPQRDVDRYLDLAARHNLRITAAAETHIHADFLSGVRQLCAQDTDITAILPGEGGDDWTHTWPQRDGCACTRVRDNDEFTVGNIHFRVIHTPGHTPEHVAYVVTDRGSGADTPMGVITGDFVFVGDLGRPDLLETAAGHAGTMRDGAEQLARSAERFAHLPEHLQVWPGHGAGSACGKALGAVPSSTVGYERLTNAALRLAHDHAAFVDSILEGQPEPPSYFARMKTDNRDGPAVLAALPKPEATAPDALPNSQAGAASRDLTILDTRPWSAFRTAHLPGSISAPLDDTFPTIAGSYVDPAATVALVADEQQTDAAVRALVRVGIDNIEHRIDPAALKAAETVGASEVAPSDAAAMLQRSGARILDVRRQSEFAAGHIPGAVHVPHVQLAQRLGDAPAGDPVIVNCRSGVRSARATSLLRARGINAINLEGGYLAWAAAGLPSETEQPAQT